MFSPLTVPLHIGKCLITAQPALRLILFNIHNSGRAVGMCVVCVGGGVAGGVLNI